MKWDELSWPQIESLCKKIPVVIPLGSIEQHGRHLPLVVDTLQVGAIADGAEQHIKDEAIFLPPLWLGCSEHHQDFPGTLSLMPSIYSSVVTGVVQSVLRAGFSRILLLNGHGGNEVPAVQALNELIAKDPVAESAQLCFASWWHLAGDAISAEAIGMETPAISHACEYETSLSLHLRPDLVDMTGVESPPPLQDRWSHSWYGGKVRNFHRWHRLTSSGSMGNPRAASAEKGRRLLDAVIEVVVEFVRDLAHRPDTPVLKPPAFRKE